MADTVNFTTEGVSPASSLGPSGGAWTEILTGELTTASDMEVASGAVEYIEAAASSTPNTALVGKKLLQLDRAGESQTIATVASGQAIFARAFGSQPAVLVVTPGA